MARNVVRYRLPAFEEIRRTPAIKAELQRHAQSIATEAGFGYQVETGEGKTRSRAAVVAETPWAKRDNSRNNTLARILANRRVGL